MITANEARKLVNKTKIKNRRQEILHKKELRKVKSEIRKAAKKGLRLCYFKNLSKNSRKQLEIAGFTVQLLEVYLEEPNSQLWEISWND